MTIEKLLRELGKARVVPIHEVLVRLLDSDGEPMLLSIKRVSEGDGVVLLEAEE